MSFVRSRRYPELFKKDKSGPWWCYVPNPAGGRKLRKPTRLRDEKLAHDWYLENIRASHGSALEGASQKERTLRAALADRIAWLKVARASNDPSRKKLAAPTIDFYDAKSAPLLDLLGRDTFLSAIGHKEIRRYIVKRSKSCKATTIAKEFTTLSMAMRLARKDGINCPVFADILPEDFAANYVPRTRWLPEDQVDAMLGELPEKRRALFAFLVCTGATYPSEVQAVRPGHVVGQVVHLPGTKSGARDRFVHVPSYGRRFLKIAMQGLSPTGFESWTNIRDDLHAAARRLSTCAACRDAARRQGGRLSAVESGHVDTVRLIQALRGGGMSYDRIAAELIAKAVPSVRGGTWFKASVRKLALASLEPPSAKEKCARCEKVPVFAPLSPNDLRRTFAQWLVRSGVPYELAAPMMGHNSIKMLQQVYGKRDAGAIAKLVELALKSAPKNARRAG